MIEKINKYIEHTILKPDAAVCDIEKVAKEALENEFFGVCINLNYVELMSDLLKGSDVKIVTVINFPLPNNTIDIIQAQAQKALDLGVDEVDTVINIAALKNKDYKKVESDIKKTKEICANNNLKVILETDLLSKEEVSTASKCAIEAGADFIKTSTGFVKNGVGATIENVEIMYQIASAANKGVKASGGIKNYTQAQGLIKAGASRLGTSSGVQIILGEKNV